MNSSYTTKVSHCFNAKLAHKIGVDAAIVLNQINFWANRCGKEIKHEKGLWIYNTFQDWKEQFGYWSLSKIKRIFLYLESKRLIVSKKINSYKWNHTKWYCIDYDMLEVLLCDIEKSCNSSISKKDNRLIQNEPFIDRTKNNYTNNSSISPQGEKSVVRENNFIKEWNSRIASQNVHLTLKRKAKFNKVLSLHFNNDLGKWEKFISTIENSNFLMGKVTDFKISFDWILKEPNLLKVLEGNYQNRNNNKFNQEPSGVEAQKIDKPINEINERWKKVMEKAVAVYGQETYVSWFSKIKFIAAEKGKVLLEYTNSFIKEWIETHYLIRLSKIWEECFAEQTKFEFCYASSQKSNI